MSEYLPKWRAKISVASIDDDPRSAYFRWNEDELEIRGFLIASNRAMREWFNAHSSAAEREAAQIRRNHGDPEVMDTGDVYDLFIDLSGVDPQNYWWQLSSAVAKDACSLYEVYLERAADEVLERFGFWLKTHDTENSWKWSTCRDFYETYFNINVTPSPVEHIIWMRNKMTHLRDELRTEEGAVKFSQKLEYLAISDPATAEEKTLALSDSVPAWAHGVRLSALEAYRILNIIRSQVNQAAELLSAFRDGTRSTGHLDALKAGSPLGVRDLNPDRLLMRARSPWERED